MTGTLRVLLVEDCLADAELLVRSLVRSGLSVSWQQAETAGQLQQLLDRQSWDLVLADFSLPQFSAMAALMMVRERELDLPFVVVSGVVGEETAVEAMRAGAHDFVTKDNLARLGPVVEREVRSARERQAWRESAEVAGRSREIEEASQVSATRREWFLPFVLASSLTLAVTFCTRILQEWWVPDLAHWKANLLVLVVSGPVAAICVYYLLSRRQALMQRMITELVERRRLNEMRRHLAERTRELEAKMLERQRRERHLQAQHSITRIMAGSRPLQDALPALLQSICETLDWEAGEFWSLDDSATRLSCTARFDGKAVAVGELAAEKKFAVSSSARERLSQRVWAGGKPTWIEDVRQEEPLLAVLAEGDSGYRSALAFPVRLGQEFLGVMVFVASRLRTVDRELLELLEDIGNQIGQFVERRRAETALQRAHEELELRVRRRTAELASLNEALSRSEANLRQAQQIARLGSFEAYAPFRFSYGNYWSEEACRILGLDPTQTDIPLDDFVSRLVHPEDRSRFQQKLARLEDRSIGIELEHRVVRSDGTIRFVRMLAEPRFDENARLLKLVGTLHDVTERKQLEKQVLEVSENEQRRIGQDLHDDLCQHLAGIEFMSQALHQRLENAGNREADLAHQVADLVRGAINQTRSLARGLSPVQLESRGLTAALQDLAEHVHHLFNVECNLAADPQIEVRNITVATHLYRIAQEAINNAIRHGKADRIEIELHCDEELASLRVGDNGAGFVMNQTETGKGMGLRIMHYRAGMIGASLNVSPGRDRGVVVECIFRTEV